MSNTLAHALRTFGVMLPEYPPITEIPDYVWRMKQPSFYPRPRRTEPKDTAAVFYHANGEEALKAAKNGARGGIVVDGLDGNVRVDVFVCMREVRWWRGI